MNHIPGKFPPGSSKTRPRRRAEYSDDAVVGLREPGTIVCRCWNLRRRVAIRSWSATDQAIARPCQVARGGVTRQGITSLVEWMVQARTLAKLEGAPWRRNTRNLRWTGVVAGAV